MPDTSVVEVTEEDLSANSGEPRKQPRRRTSLWGDPVATTLVFAIGIVIIGALLVAVFAILNGVVNLGSAPPATLNQALLQRAKGTVSEEKDAASYASLVMTQVDNKDIPGAR